jgi:hypothetical protein
VAFPVGASPSCTRATGDFRVPVKHPRAKRRSPSEGASGGAVAFPGLREPKLHPCGRGVCAAVKHPKSQAAISL